MNHYYELREFMKTIRPISTHSHHLPDNVFADGFDLKTLLENSYSGWCGVELGDTPEQRVKYFAQVKHRNFFKVTERALQTIYGIDAPLRADSYDVFDTAIRKAHSEVPAFHLKILTEIANFERIILDTSWAPGGDHGHSELFTPILRIDSFLVGYDPDLLDHDENNCVQLYDHPFDDLDTFLDSMRQVILTEHKNGAVALKHAMAYERGLDVELVSKEQARRVFEKGEGNYDSRDIKAFQDYMFMQICEIAAELDLPIQVHTGLGRLTKSNAYLLQPLIEAFPKTKFVLLHGSYPWMDDILGLVHVYPDRVFPDLVWLPQISTEAAIRMLSELIEVTNSHSICWGDDSWTSEETYGSLLSAQHVIATVLSNKVCSNYMSLEEAKVYVKNILRDNARRLYKLG